MKIESDRFKINWTERTRENTVVSVTGFSFQIDSWKSDLFKKYPKKHFNTRMLTSINNPDGTITATFSRSNGPGA